MGFLVPALFRLISLMFFVFVCYKLHWYAVGHENITQESFLIMTKFLTFLVLILEVLYFSFATPLQAAGRYVMHGCLFCLTTCAAVLVCIMFWSLFVYDKGLLIERGGPAFPLWLTHSSHSLGAMSNILDGILWSPQSVHLGICVMALVLLAGGYITYLERLINSFGIYPYPLLRNLTFEGRIILYAVSAVLLLLCFTICYIYTRFLVRRSKKSSTDKVLVNHQKKTRSGTGNAPVKTKKVRKAD